jgi:cellulose synthase/poly-beta-1,6-N-acetylglucosamine synthase-like glycosyltransferase
MRGGDLLTRLQRAEFARWTDTSLRRGWTSVLAGTGCAIRQDALRAVVATDDREGPWSYDSQVEDFELTYRIRQLGWRCQVSPTVRAYTDSMRSLRALWGQRMKWQVGTVEDLLRFGVDRWTLLDWRQQVAGLAAAVCRVGWVGLTVLALALHAFTFHPVWLLLTLLFIANDVRQSLRVPHRDRLDVLVAALLLPQELFAWLRAGWFTAAWAEALVGRVTHRSRDRWALQYRAEGV